MTCQETSTGSQHDLAGMVYDSKSDWAPAFASGITQFRGPPSFQQYLQVLALCNSVKHPTAPRLVTDPSKTAKQEGRKYCDWDGQAAWLSYTLLPMLNELGLHFKRRSDLKASCDDRLVDHGLLLDKNGQLNVHGKHLDNTVTRKIKVDLQNGRETCCTICRRGFTFLAEEAFRKKRCLKTWASLYSDFMMLDHRRGRPSDYRSQGLDNVCIPCHYLKSKNLPPFHLCYGYEVFFQG